MGDIYLESRMPDLSFVTVDVFTRTRFAGNPLAIVNIPKGHDVSDDQMQIIAREFNLSETVFLHEGTTDDEGLPEWRVRIFLTDREVPFVSHLRDLQGGTYLHIGRYRLAIQPLEPHATL